MILKELVDGGDAADIIIVGLLVVLSPFWLPFYLIGRLVRVILGEWD